MEHDQEEEEEEQDEGAALLAYCKLHAACRVLQPTMRLLELSAWICLDAADDELESEEKAKWADKTPAGDVRAGAASMEPRMQLSGGEFAMFSALISAELNLISTLATCVHPCWL